MVNKRKLERGINLTLIMVVFLASLMTFNSQTNLKDIKDNSVKEKEDNNIFTGLNKIKPSGDGTRYYEANAYYINQESFNSNYGAWTAVPGGGLLAIDSGAVNFTIKKDLTYNNRPRIEYNPPSFYKGVFQVRWRVSNLESGESLQVKYMVGTGSDWASATTLGQTTSTSYTVSTFILDDATYNTLNPNFKLAIILNSDRDGLFDSADYGYVDGVQLQTHEFFIFESTGDTIGQQLNQDLEVMVFPSVTSNPIDKVFVEYKLDDSDLSSGTTTIISPDSSNNYTITFSNIIYNSSQTVYYKVVVNETDGWSSESNGGTAYSFSTIDTTNPTLSNLHLSDSTPEYDGSTTLTVDASEIPQDSGLASVYLYVKNGSAATTSDFRIVDSSAVYPSWSESFSFVIPDYCLTYRERLYYLVRATDNAGHYSDLTGSISVDDSKAPNLTYNGISDSTPEYDQDVTVNYTISEPSDASGFYTDGSRIYLRYKLNSAPTSVNDYNGQVGPSNTPLNRDGGDVLFTIPESVFAYDDTVYYFLNIEDQVGNSNNDYSSAHSFSSHDSTSPSVTPGSTNTDNANYLGDKTLYFEVTEPSDASGVNKSSLTLWFKVNDTNLDSGAISIPYSNEVSDNYSFVIGYGNYSLNDDVYYKLNGSDMVGNTFETGINSFHVVDLEGPYIHFISSNNTGVKYYQSVEVVVDSDDDSLGVGFDNIIMFVRNGSEAQYFGVSSVRVDYASKSGTQYTFIINSDLLSARERLYYVIRANDTAGNWKEYRNNFSVGDDVVPYIWFNTISPSSVNYNDTVQVQYYIHEPLAGSGFPSNIENLRVYYFVGTPSLAPSSSSDYTGYVYSTSSLNIDGGVYSMSLSASIFGYGDRVYYWAWARDNGGNTNDTFSADLRYFDVIDSYSPTLSVNGASLTNCSYDTDKDIIFTSTEPSDGSGLSIVRVFWKLNDPSVSDSNYDGMVPDNNLNHDGGQLSLKILANSINGSYGDKVYFIVQSEDSASNKITSSVFYFNVSDSVLPTISQPIENTYNIMRDYGKVFEATIWDPDFPRSSGIYSVTLYYRLNNSDVTTTNYDGVLIPEETIVQSLKNYTFKLDPNITRFWGNSTDVYFFFSLKDINGNSYNSPVKSFKVVVTITPNFIYPLPASKKYYYNTYLINISIIVNVPCDIWYKIDDYPPSAHYFGLSYYTNIELPNKTEGVHYITIYYFSEQFNKTFELYIDMTPTSPVSTINIETIGNTIVLTWTPPADADDLTYYRIYRSESPNGPFEYWGDTHVGITTFTDFGCKPGKTYYYKIFAVDRAGNISEASKVISITMPIPWYFYIILLIAATMAVITIVKIKANVNRKKALKRLGDVSEEELEKFNITDEALTAKQKDLGSAERITIDTTTGAVKEAEWKEINIGTAATAKRRYDRVMAQPAPIYWNNSLKTLVENALKHELQGRIGAAIKYYNIALRAAELSKPTDNELVSFLKEKLINIYSDPLKN
ncbi:MAG: fibronectin type III domain-containing protein [Promethearchaeota archaeon]